MRPPQFWVFHPRFVSELVTPAANNLRSIWIPVHRFSYRWGMGLPRVALADACSCFESAPLTSSMSGILGSSLQMLQALGFLASRHVATGLQAVKPAALVLTKSGLHSDCERLEQRV